MLPQFIRNSCQRHQCLLQILTVRFRFGDSKTILFLSLSLFFRSIFIFHLKSLNKHFSRDILGERFSGNLIRLVLDAHIHPSYNLVFMQSGYHHEKKSRVATKYYWNVSFLLNFINRTNEIDTHCIPSTLKMSNRILTETKKKSAAFQLAMPMPLHQPKERRNSLVKRIFEKFKIQIYLLNKHQECLGASSSIHYKMPRGNQSKRQMNHILQPQFMPNPIVTIEIGYFRRCFDRIECNVRV